jgi:hypothetical protein
MSRLRISAELRYGRAALDIGGYGKKTLWNKTTDRREKGKEEGKWNTRCPAVTFSRGDNEGSMTAVSRTNAMFGKA